MPARLLPLLDALGAEPLVRLVRTRLKRSAWPASPRPDGGDPRRPRPG
ncbi:hypothetical protein ACTMTI_55665 [Nonomuraea sp. H19]